MKNLKGRRHNLRELDVGGRVILKLTLKKQVVRLFIAFIWFSIESSGRLL
jgi:hypothetical protein